MPLPASLTIHPIDATLVVLYFLGVAALGLWLSRGVKSGKDLFLGGRSLPWWAVGTSLVVSDIGAKDMVGLADDGYRYGMVMMNFDFIGCIFPVLVAAFLFMPYLWLAGVYTIPEYLGRRYNRTVRTLFALIWGTSMVAMLATIFVSAATMFEHLLGWNFYLSVGILTVLVGVYTTMGGLKAVVFTDFVSCIVLIVGAALICIYGLAEVGGWSELYRRVSELPGTENHFKLVLPADAPRILLALGAVGPGIRRRPRLLDRQSGDCPANAGERQAQSAARASYILCAAIKMVFPILLVVPGLIGLALFYDQIRPQGQSRLGRGTGAATARPVVAPWRAGDRAGRVHGRRHVEPRLLRQFCLDPLGQRYLSAPVSPPTPTTAKCWSWDAG